METPKLKNLILLLFFTLFASISEAQEIGFPTIRNYTPKEYNNSTQIFGAVQDVRGVFYFGVTDGLMEYDGVSWRTISNKKQAYTYDLAKDKNGKIYVGANNEFGYLATDSIGNTIYKSLTHLLRDKTFKLGAVWSVKLTSKYVYFRTYDAILQYSPTDENLHIFKACFFLFLTFLCKKITINRWIVLSYYFFVSLWVMDCNSSMLFLKTPT